MPCQSDYLAASGKELESIRVCKFLIYVYEKLVQGVPDWVRQAAETYYGNINRLDEATAMLCECCRGMGSHQREAIVYDAHNKTARELASWWEHHLEWDRRRVKEEDETRRRIILKERALRKLTTDEMEALGLT